MAAEDGYEDIVDLLCKHGADIRLNTAKSRTPLMHASKSSPLLRRLLAEGLRACPSISPAEEEMALEEGSAEGAGARLRSRRSARGLIAYAA